MKHYTQRFFALPLRSFRPSPELARLESRRGRRCRRHRRRPSRRPSTTWPTSRLSLWPRPARRVRDHRSLRGGSFTGGSFPPRASLRPATTPSRPTVRQRDASPGPPPPRWTEGTASTTPRPSSAKPATAVQATVRFAAHASGRRGGRLHGLVAPFPPFDRRRPPLAAPSTVLGTQNRSPSRSPASGVDEPRQPRCAALCRGRSAESELYAPRAVGSAAPRISSTRFPLARYTTRRVLIPPRAVASSPPRSATVDPHFAQTASTRTFRKGNQRRGREDAHDEVDRRSRALAGAQRPRGSARAHDVSGASGPSRSFFPTLPAPAR